MSVIFVCLFCASVSYEYMCLWQYQYFFGCSKHVLLGDGAPVRAGPGAGEEHPLRVQDSQCGHRPQVSPPPVLA